MMVMVWRTIAVRVRPDDLLVFRRYDDEGGGQEEGGDLLLEGAGEDRSSGEHQRGPQQLQLELPPATNVDVGGASPLPDDARSPNRGLWQKVGLGWIGRSICDVILPVSRFLRREFLFQYRYTDRRRATFVGGEKIYLREVLPDMAQNNTGTDLQLILSRSYRVQRLMNLWNKYVL